MEKKYELDIFPDFEVSKVYLKSFHIAVKCKNVLNNVVKLELLTLLEMFSSLNLVTRVTNS